MDAYVQNKVISRNLKQCERKRDREREEIHICSLSLSFSHTLHSFSVSLSLFVQTGSHVQTYKHTNIQITRTFA
jgi:hypothetical protein